MNMKAFSPLILLFLIVVAVFLSGCSMLYQEPEITVGTVDLVDINATELVMDVTLEIENPNPFGIMFNRITADVLYRAGDTWEPLSHVEKEGIDIRSGKNTVVMPVSAKNADLIKAGFSMFLTGEITIQVNGIAEPSFFGISPAIPFNQTRTISLP